MTYYAKGVAVVQVAESSDYNSPNIMAALFKEYTTPTASLDMVLAAATGGTTVPWTSFTTIRAVFVQNLSTSIITTLTYRTGGGSATTQTVALPTEEWIKLVDVTASTAGVLTSASGTPSLRVIVFGT